MICDFIEPVSEGFPTYFRISWAGDGGAGRAKLGTGWKPTENTPPPVQTFSTLRSHFSIIGILTVLYLLLYTTFLLLKSAEYIHRAMGNF